MEAARTIRQAVAQVSRLRDAGLAQPELRQAVAEVKRMQSRRFAGTYADLMAGGPYADAARFFLDELYSDKDYAERDSQFSRIAGAIEKFFPAQVVLTAVALAQLHALTEDLDQAMAVAWLSLANSNLQPGARYAASWRAVGRRGDRQSQLTVVLDIGRQMARLTRTPGLRIMLRMMRAPASAAGLGSLQGFLESGFDTFAKMAGRQGAQEFLSIIERRESALMAMLFDADLVACETGMENILGQAR